MRNRRSVGRARAVLFFFLRLTTVDVEPIFFCKMHTSDWPAALRTALDILAFPVSSANAEMEF